MTLAQSYSVFEPDHIFGLVKSLLIDLEAEMPTRAKLSLYE